MDGDRTQFVADDFLPNTGNPWPDDGLSMLAAEATMLGTFDGTYMGYPWSTSAVLHVLAGLGHIFEPRRMALAVI